jgi:hypothetical protein
VPWLDAADRCSALKYRFIDQIAKADKARRFHQKRRSGGVLFGANLAIGEADSLAIVEGELNSMSLWQACSHQGFHVVSLGPKANQAGLRALQRRIEQRPYRRVLAWLDEAADALAVANATRAVPMKSPNGRDANDILVAHGPEYLADLIEAVLRRSLR